MAVFSASVFNPAVYLTGETPPTPSPPSTPMASARWYYKDAPKEKREAAEELEDRYVELLEQISPPDDAPESIDYQPQKQVLARNLARQIGVLQLLGADEIRLIIAAAEQRYAEHLADLRRREEDVAILLLLN